MIDKPWVWKQDFGGWCSTTIEDDGTGVWIVWIIEDATFAEAMTAALKFVKEKCGG